MEVTPGYKMTEVGVVPEDWVVKRLEDLGPFLKGQGVKRDDVIADGLACIRYGELYTHYNDYIFTPVSRISPLIASTSQPIKTGDLLFAASGETAEEIGKCAAYLGDEMAYAGGDIIILRPTGQSSLFLGYLMNHQAVVSQKARMGQGNAVVHISSRNLGQLVVCLPSLVEQEAIAEALSDADAFIDSLEQLIAKKRQLKQGAMQELLTGNRRLPGFSGEWKTKYIGEFTDCIAGGTPSTQHPEYWGGPIRWMSSGELNLKHVHEVAARIAEEGLRHSSTKLIPPKCVLIGLAGQGKTRGTVAMNMVTLCTNQSIAAVFPNDAYIPEFLYFNLDGRYDELRAMSTGDSGRGGLNLRIIRSVLIPFPPLDEQTAIATVLSDKDAELAALETELNKARQLKQGMMHDLLTGRIRLV